YTPPSASFTGVDTIAYNVTDTATNTTAAGAIIINVATLIVGPGRVDDLIGTTRTVDLGPVVQDVTTNPTLSFDIPTTSADGGFITNIDHAKGTFSYTPPTETFTGTDTLAYTVVDTATEAIATGTVTIDVEGLFADALSVAETENTAKTIDLSSGVHDITANPTLTFTIPAHSAQGGGISNVDTAKGTFTYTPPSPSFLGTDTLTYSVTDAATHDTASALVTINVAKPELTITATSPANGSVVTALPNGKIVITFNHPLLASSLSKAGTQQTGLLTSDPYSVFLIARGPAGAFSAPQASHYEGGDVPIHANTTYKVNANGTSQITITPTAPLAADVYAISVNGAYTDTNGDTLAAGTGQSTFYATFLLQPPATNGSPLQVTGVTAFNNFETINNNLIYQPDTIAIHFNKPLFAGAANGNTVQLLAKQGSSDTVVPSVAAYSPTTDSIDLTPTALLNPGTVYLIRVAGQDSGSAYVSDNQGYGNPGYPLATTFYDTFTVRNVPVGAGQAPLQVATANGGPDTMPTTGVIWNVPVGYASITFTQPVALSSFGRYSAMLVPAGGGLNPTAFDAADVPLNATLAFNPNLNVLIITPSQPVGNDLYLYALSGIDAAQANGQPNPADPLLNNSGLRAGGGNAPYYKTFEVTVTTPSVAVTPSTASAAVVKPEFAVTVPATHDRAQAAAASNVLVRRPVRLPPPAGATARKTRFGQVKTGREPMVGD
ncbi:MAG: Ig-like domain-containing protein, partial [Isosphaeraceae bacterium]|nr:Ig-like domain-containing protein [Isosphaeraceae bacterium]